MFLLWISVYINLLLLSFLHLYFAFKEFSANVIRLLFGLFCLFLTLSVYAFDVID